MRESRETIAIATAERSPPQEFVNEVERQHISKELKRRPRVHVAACGAQETALERPRRLKLTRHIDVLQNKLKQEAETKTGWERQLHNRAADALQQDLDLRKLYIDTGVGLGRWKHMSTASGSAPRVGCKRGQECNRGTGTKNARNKDAAVPEFCARMMPLSSST